MTRQHEHDLVQKKKAAKKTRRKSISRRKKGRDLVEQYALDVLSGKELAGPLVRLSCERHLKDLKDGPKRGLTWEWPSAKYVIGFFSDCLMLAGGQFEGKPFRLHPSQAFIVGSLFGWKASDGFRRFRVGYIEQAKGSGKSPLGAGIGIYMMTSDGEPRAEVYSAAVDKDQAAILFRDAVAMVDQSPALDSRVHRSGGRGKEWNLAYLENGSFFRPISSEHRGRGKSGPRPHCALLDEIHEHPTNAMVEFMRAGTKSRRQALMFMITNSGFDRQSVCYHYHEYAEKILNGQLEDDSFFAYVCGLDAGDDWKDEKVWPKANPLIDITPGRKYIQEQVREAIGMPSKQSLVRRLNFCEWTESEESFIDPEVWKANAGKPVKRADLKGESCYGGLDLSGKNDLTALVLVFPNRPQKVVLSFFWTPGGTLLERQDRDHAPYTLWRDQGHLIAKDGTTIDYRWVAKTIGELTSEFHIEAIAFDRYRIDDLQRELDAEGVSVTLVSHGQGFKDMDPAIEALEDDLLEEKLAHGNQPVLGWCVSNALISQDPAGLRKFDKRKATGRIDGAVAMAMADNLSVFYPAGQVDMDDVIDNIQVV